MSDPKIIEKIQKLLALADSSTPNEASAALVRAQALMEKYNISLSEVEVREAEYQSSEKIELLTSNIQPWEINLAGIIASNFDCRSLIISGARGFRKPKVQFFGTKTDTEIASYIFCQLRVRIQTMAYIATGQYTESVKKESGYSPRWSSGRQHPKSWRTSWITGVVEGIGEQLRRSKKDLRNQSTDQSFAIVNLKDERLEVEFKNAFPSLSQFEQDREIRNFSAFNTGVNTGRNMGIFDGIEVANHSQLS